ncbi:hypothetical protein QA5_00558 [Enterococcus faecalis EnGen0083]|uniref:hypothetical protein n=1 Tax=Enterococcus faecalis TaxID=1351 RepID=UPI00033101BF|nr:hypothetical protein [Enterococcus faecalis]DAU70130.1 MAG TPA: HK97 Family Phage Portal Protein [Caudoviricetes sp.]EOE02777.1 hypothetical protein Q9K_00384 [Enterococcus faecalis EnGen0075]EOE17992.1 hypothetical protein Q9W_00894 [Enterococcus faecalis EnGen0060]EOE25037.1 hypothetical protein QA5_00558 [Enterococcus faecalis EnGen0083]HBI1997704.1 hypothetical protein [Enterococcus faecalis]
MSETELVGKDELLKAMTMCNSCPDFNLNDLRGKGDNNYQLYDWLIHNLPTAQYVLGKLVELIFSNNLTTGDEKQDEILNNFLYGQTNPEGVTNYHVLVQSIKESIVYGRSGLRFLSKDDGLINVKCNHFGVAQILNKEHYGYKELIGFVIDKKGRAITDVDLREGEIDSEEYFKKGIFVFKNSDNILLPPEKFVNLRVDTSTPKGSSVFDSDIQRVLLIASVYKRLLYDIEYDGAGRLIFWADNANSNEESSNKFLNDTESATKRRQDKYKKEVEEIMKLVKDSNSTSVLAVSNAFKKMDHLPRVTKATEFLSYLNQEGEIMAQVFGVPNVLLGLGKISGNISMEKVIDNAMLNSIIPLRENIATQISSILTNNLKVPKVYFDKYELKSQSDINDRRLKVLTVAERLKALGKEDLANKIIEEEIQL